MVTYNKIISLTILFVCSTALAGCSFFAGFYIVNKSDKSVKATIQFVSSSDVLKADETSLSLRYADTILQPNDNTRELLTQKLIYRQTNSNTIEIDIPKNSTVLIGGTANRAVAADSIKFIINDIVQAYTPQTISKHLKKSGGLFPPFHFTYTIEKPLLTMHLQ